MEENIYFKSAPQLKHDIDKNAFNTHGNFYMFSQDVMDKVYEKLGTSSAQMRVLQVLIGTKPGFALTNKWLQDRTKLNKSNLHRTIVKLDEIHLITRDLKKNSITVNFKELMK